MKKKKLTLDHLKVKSFVTVLENKSRTIRGGDYLTQFNCQESWDCTGGNSQACGTGLPCPGL